MALGLTHTGSQAYDLVTPMCQYFIPLADTQAVEQVPPSPPPSLVPAAATHRKDRAHWTRSDSPLWL